MADVAHTFIDNSAAREQQALLRQQRLAEILQQQAFQPDQKFSYAGIEASPSAAGALAKGLQGGIAGYLQGRSLKGQDDLLKKTEAREERYGTDLAKALGAANTKPWVNPDGPGAVGNAPIYQAGASGLRSAEDPAPPPQMMPGADQSMTPFKAGPAGGYEAIAAALQNIGNPDVSRTLGPQITMAQIAQQQAGDKRTQGLADAKELYTFQQTNKGPADAPAEVKEFEYAQKNGFPGSFMDFQTQKRRAGATTVTVGGDNAADGALRKKLSEKEGERWSALKEAGAVSAGLGQDFQALDQLMTVAPQGPVTGRLAEAFPGFSSAGDAFQSIVTRVAPTLRTPGSGATSDIEYEGMLKSLPRLRFKQEANRAIGEMMKSKAALNVERSEIVSAYENQKIDAATARSALEAVNKKSIISPELKTALEGLVGPTEAPKVGAVQDGYRFKGGEPASPNSWEKI